MRSYARCGFFKGSVRGEILPKSGEKSRHQPVFFYARAEAENLGRRKPSRYTSRQIYCTSYQLFCGNAKTHNAFPQNSFPARAVCHKELFARARYQGFQLTRAQQKAPAWEKGWNRKRFARSPGTQINTIATILAGAAVTLLVFWEERKTGRQ